MSAIRRKLFSSSRVRSSAARESLRRRRSFWQVAWVEQLEDRTLLSASQDLLWQTLEAIPDPSGGEVSYIDATHLQPLTLDTSLLQSTLASTLMEFSTDIEESLSIITVPTPGGQFDRFRILETLVMSPALAANFPEIKTYLGQGIDDPAATVRFDLTPAGFHAQVLTPNGSFMVDPYWHLDDSLYVSYFRSDAIQVSDFEEIESDDDQGGQQRPAGDSEYPTAAMSGGGGSGGGSGSGGSGSGGSSGGKTSNGQTLRTFRTAVAATGEYTVFHGGTVAAGQAAIVTAINRVTAIYENDLAIRLELVANNLSLVYTNPATDPYTNDDPSALLGENQTNVDNVIGNANYDIGHVFTTGGGGLARLRSVGITGQKAQGETGIDKPIGDAFYVDYVSHEMGHQFGGNHTFNGDSGQCMSGNRNGGTAYEPGSGSTIQAYAGICGNDNLQNSSDAMFHHESLREMLGHVATIPGAGSSMNTNNSVPVVNAGADFTIPARTPFILTATGSDADGGDVLTYSWEQRDLGPQQDVNAGDNGSSPLFRSFSPTTDPTRTFPRLSDLVNNTTVIGETLPTTTRAFNFRVVARDNRAGGGGIDTDDMRITVVDTGNPFAITSFNSSTTLTGGSVEAITWDVAGTDANGINAANVDILFSSDGGNNFVTFVTNTANDGSEDIIIPNIGTTEGRFTIQGAGNIFFDINDTDVTVIRTNTPPTISDITDKTIDEDQTTGDIPFTIGDAETTASFLTVGAASSDTTLVPNGNIILGGSGANRTIKVTPVADLFGTVAITVTVTDGGGDSTFDTFLLTVNSVNDNPTITSIANQTIDEDNATNPLSFTIDDIDSPLGNLVLSATSSNTTLVPNTNVTFGGNGASRTTTVTPAANQFGTTTITITLIDGAGGTATEIFDVTVNPINDDPTITSIGNQTIDEDTSTSALPFTVDDVESAAANLTLSGMSSNTVLIPIGNIMFGGSGANRTVMVTPTMNEVGTTTITVTVTDEDGDTSTETFDVIVDPVNDDPSISDIGDQTIDEDNFTSAMAFTVDDIDSQLADLTPSATSSNTMIVPNGNIVFGGSSANRTVTVTPAANQFGSVTITVNLSDGAGGSATDSFEVTINSINDLPTVTDVVDQAVDEDISTAALAFTVGDIETSAGSLAVSSVSSNTTLIPNDNIVFGGTGTGRNITVTPAENEFGTATITFTVTDQDGGIATDTFDVTVNSVNDLPQISMIDNQATDEDKRLTVAFVISDVETSADVLTIEAVSSNATLIPSSGIMYGGAGNARTITLTPTFNQFGISTITLLVSDADDEMGIEQFDVTVNSVNDRPTISGIGPKTINVNTTTDLLEFTIGDVETAADSLIVTGGSLNTALIPDANIMLGGSEANRTVTITPAVDQIGTAIITLTALDDDGKFAMTSFAVTVNGLPTISDIADRAIDEDAMTGAIEFTIGDAETDDGSLSVSVTSPDDKLFPEGSFELGGSGNSRTLVATPAANAFGQATVTVTVADGDGGLTSDSFLLTVNSVNDVPTISGLTDVESREDRSAGIVTFIVGDVESPATELTVSSNSSNTTLIPNSNIVIKGQSGLRRASIIPAHDQFGTATITITVSDPDGNTVSDTFDVTIGGVNDRPTLSDIPDQTTVEDIPTAAIAVTVGDLETDLDLLTLTATSSNPLLLPVANVVFGGSGANRTVTLNPSSNQSGLATVTVTVTDGEGATTSDLVFFEVIDLNDAPFISGIADLSVLEDTATTAIPFSIGDLETSANSLTVVGSSSNTTLVPTANVVFASTGADRSVTVIPAADRTGTVTISVTVFDGSGGRTVESFDLTVDAINDPPDLSDISNQSTDEDTVASIGFVLTDVDTPSTSISITTTSSNTTLIPTGNIEFSGSGQNRTVTLTPASNESGTSTISVMVNDGAGGTDFDTFNITVNPINDSPSISAIANQTVDEDDSTGAIDFTVGDQESSANVLTVIGSSDNPTLFPPGSILVAGTEANRNVTLTPATDQTGTATVSLVASDDLGGSTTETFEITVNGLNDAPTISSISDQVTNENTSATIGFTISDLETAASGLSLTATSSDVTTSLMLGGSGATRTITVTPGLADASTITVTVTDADGATAGTSFNFTVNNLPTISDIADQTTNEDTPTASMGFSVNDSETASGDLTLSGVALNSALIPAGNIVFGGNGTNRTVTVTPAANQFGTTMVTISVGDSDSDSGSASDVFSITVTSVNDIPTISSILTQFIDEDSSTGAIDITVSDVESASGSIMLAADSSNPSLIPTSGLALGGSGAQRTVTVTPNENQFGSAIVTVTANDGQGGTATTMFTVIVNSNNDLPVLSEISNRSATVDVPVDIAFTISDLETATASLSVVATSSNTELIPVDNISFAGSGTNRTATITPASGQKGTSSIILTVTDEAGGTAAETFVIAVNAAGRGAGSVRVAVRGGRLKLFGDRGDNSIRIEVGSNPNQLRVIGEGNTLINGDTEGVFDGVENGIRASMRGGDDTLIFRGNLGTMTIDEILSITTGSGDDLIVLDGTGGQIIVKGKTRISTGDDDDTVKLIDVVFGDTVNLLTGLGNDEVSIDDSTFQAVARIRTGGGDDRLLIEQSPDRGAVATVFERAARINLGAGNDLLRIGLADSPENFATFERTTTFDGGGGLDSIDAGLADGIDGGRNVFNRDLTVRRFEDEQS